MRAVYYLSIILPVLALAVSGWRGDWTWSLLSVIALIVILLPAVITKDFNQTYHKKVAVLFPIPFVDDSIAFEHPWRAIYCPVLP